MTKNYYITSAIPYVNAKPHIGHALEFVQADVVSRHHRMLGEEVLYLTGADENALKNVQAAEKAGKEVQEFVDENAKIFQDLLTALNVHVDVFQKGSDQKTHFPSSQELWKRCLHDIYKKEYKGLYCVGCELFYEREELNEKGECFEHPGKKLEEVSETNYFFKLSRYQNKLRDLIESDTLKITPQFRKNEVLSFLKQPLHDISISRSNERAKNWGVPVPGDPTQRMYVWFDALNIYRSGIDEKRWPADLHVIGKGIIRFHAVYWPAFLLSAGLALPKELFVHGYITVEGQKMSKSVGNVVDPFDLIKKYGVDAVRYYLLREIPSYGDGDFSERRFKELYNADLANGLGNLVARVARLAEQANIQITKYPNNQMNGRKFSKYHSLLKEYRFNESLAFIWEKIREIDRDINEKKPWEAPEKHSDTLTYWSGKIVEIAVLLAPFLPETAEKIQKQFSGQVKSGEPLFPRLA